MSQGRAARYEEIADHLRHLVNRAGPGERLPSEAELCEQFGVSRMTARHAVQQVEAEGLIERRRGAGTFVRSRPVPRDLGSPLSFSENMRARSMKPTSRTLQWGRVVPTTDERTALGLEDGDGAFALERLRCADHVPMALERAVMSEGLASSIAEHIEEGSLHDMFRAIGRTPSLATAEVSARHATKRQRDLLDLPSTGIVIVERRTIFDHADLPLERTVTWYAASRYSFKAVLVSGDYAGHR
ncbi:MAG TPA: GntR family transcriptional regulator [Acidimicrobiia bacterium]|nr:GntR family transcriptional regulator [Acidimicrobiia bacterium]